MPLSLPKCKGITPVPEALPFTVDTWGSPEAAAAGKAQFLTHAHKDHMRRMERGAARVFCTRTTLELLRVKLPAVDWVVVERGGGGGDEDGGTAAHSRGGRARGRSAASNGAADVAAAGAAVRVTVLEPLEPLELTAPPTLGGYRYSVTALPCANHCAGARRARADGGKDGAEGAHAARLG